VRALRLGVLIGFGSIAAGFLVLLVSAFAEVLADPSLSLEDGYWIGRLPWTAVGVGLVVGGSHLALVAGTLAAWIVGGAIRRLGVSLLVLVGAWWWLLVFLEGGVGAGCPGCVPSGPDPITAAYSLPQNAVLFLVLPAVLAGLLGLTAGPRRKVPTRVAG